MQPTTSFAEVPASPSFCVHPLTHPRISSCRGRRKTRGARQARAARWHPRTTGQRCAPGKGGKGGDRHLYCMLYIWATAGNVFACRHKASAPNLTGSPCEGQATQGRCSTPHAHLHELHRLGRGHVARHTPPVPAQAGRREGRAGDGWSAHAWPAALRTRMPPCTSILACPATIPPLTSLSRAACSAGGAAARGETRKRWPRCRGSLRRTQCPAQAAAPAGRATSAPAHGHGFPPGP